MAAPALTPAVFSQICYGKNEVDGLTGAKDVAIMAAIVGKCSAITSIQAACDVVSSSKNVIEEKLARSLTAETVELLPYLPYLLQDFWALGSNPVAITELIGKYVSPTDNARVLDLACGKGAVSVNIAQKLRVRVKGIDMLPAFIEFAIQKAKEFGVDDLCEFIESDINEAIKTEKGYDCVVFVSAGNVLGNTTETLDKLKATVKSGGYLVIEDAYLSDGISQSDIKCYYEYLTEPQWMALFKEAGLDLLETFYDDSPDQESEMAAITARANELMIKYPDKKEIFESYIHSQRNEYGDLDCNLTCATWILRKL